MEWFLVSLRRKILLFWYGCCIIIIDKIGFLHRSINFLWKWSLLICNLFRLKWYNTLWFFETTEVNTQSFLGLNLKGIFRANFSFKIRNKTSNCFLLTISRMPAFVPTIVCTILFIIDILELRMLACILIGMMIDMITL